MLLRLRGRRPDVGARVRVRSITAPGCPALFASDLGHWDVPDAREVLPEAWELVEHGHVTADDFRAFTFENAVRLWGPEFFASTAVDAAVKELDA